jgi:amino acid adenylation domain-containing protein
LIVGGQHQRFTSAVPQLHDYLVESARRLPEKVALVCQGRSLAYSEIERLSNALARGLGARGVERGDRVVIFLDNTVEAVIAFWAVLKANAIVSIVNPLTKTRKLEHLLKDCRPSALVTSATHAPVFLPAAAACSHLRAVVVAGSMDESRRGRPRGFVSWNDLLASFDGETPPPRRNIDVDLAAIIYTSGSTGEPKGIMLTHRNMLAAATSVSTYLENTEDEVILDALPLSFDYGLYQLITAFRVGARLILERSFTFPSQVLKTVVTEKVTGFPGVPTMFAMMANIRNLGERDFSAVRYVTNTAAALPVRHIHFLMGLFPQARIYSMYGLTECKRCTYLPPEDLARKPESVGIAIPNTEMWVVDERDNRLGPGQVGQLVIRGATVMKGYWEKPEATARRLRPGPVPGEQVLYTGDLCRLDADGYLYFVGRMDDIIKTRGEKVAPKEVEQALVSIPGVQEAAVIGVPDPVLGQALKAFVVLDEGVLLNEKQIQVECQARLENFMVPSRIVVVASLPRTASGKVSKRELA